MIKKRQLANSRLYGANGGWAAARSVDYDGVGRVYGSPYHQVSPIVASHEWDEMIAWCVFTYGPSGTEEKLGVWSMNERWYANNAKLLFKNKEDCEWFMLRWS